MFEMENFDMDIEKLISLVEGKPVLWDRSLEDYKSRSLTLAAWRDVCSELQGGFLSFSEKEKNEFCRFVIKKWTNVKDSWVRSQKKIIEPKTPGARKCRKYIYYDRLVFLKRNGMPRETESNFKAENPDSVEEIAGVQRSTFSNEERNSSRSYGERSLSSTVKGTKRRMIDDVEIRILKNLETPSEDRHLSFFKGILPSLHQLNEDETLQFQMGVMNVLHSIRKARNDVQPVK